MSARGGSGCSHPGCGQQIGVSEAAGAGLMRCTKCRQKVYCSKACQVAGWKGGHKQECERLREGAEAGGGGSGGAAAQEALLAALLGTTRRALTGRQEQVYEMIREAFNAEKDRQVVKMAGEGLAVSIIPYHHHDMVFTTHSLQHSNITLDTPSHFFQNPSMHA